MNRAVRLVSRREASTRILSRPFVIAQIVTVAIIFAIFGLGSTLGGDDPVRLGSTTELDPRLSATIESIAELDDQEVEFETFAGREAAEAALVAGDVDGVLDGSTLLFEQIDNYVVAIVSPAFEQLALVNGLSDAGLSGEQIGQALSAGGIEIEELDADPDQEVRERVAFMSVILMFIAIQATGAYIMMAVFEEKSTKVVELVLASVRARDLLLGKIIGIGLLGVIQVAVLAIASIVAARIFGSDAVPALSFTLIGTAFVWFLLGYLLYGSVFAAASSLAPRQEDAQSTLSPIMVILMICYFASIFAAGEPTGTAAKVMSWIPLSAPFAMPGRIAARAVDWWEIVGSMLVTGVGALAALWLAERIYVRSVIHTDRMLGWREAWRMERV